MYYIIANPNSGNKKGLDVLNEVTMHLNDLDKKYKIFLSEYEEHTIELTHTALAEGANLIIAIGGDGTFMEVATAVGDRDDVAIGFIPAGNGNDFAYSLNIPDDPIEALEGILLNEATELDYISVNKEVRCLNVCGTGLDTDVLLDYNNKPTKKKSDYVKSLLKVITHLHYYNLKINIDNLQTIEGEYMLVSLCNGKRFGAKINICEEADLEDSLMDLVIIKKIEKWKIPFLLLTFLRGKHLNKPWCTHIKCKNVTIENLDGTPLTINVDGQLFQSEKLVAEIQPCKLLCLNQNIYEDEEEYDDD
ncbi:MAG: YegS/Rv2252/BmrU family lipid kinase [Clostridia bacterium]|nr:YegS/Rv2252/BmrU family lipid kinase [Clostridia bacterium]